jgi:hypothetical protein
MGKFGGRMTVKCRAEKMNSSFDKLPVVVFVDLIELFRLDKRIRFVEFGKQRGARKTV